MATTKNGKNSISDLSITKYPAKISVLNNQIKIHELEIVLPDAVHYLQQIPPAEYEQTCLRAFEMGLFCLQRVQNRTEIEFVKRQMETLLTEFNKAVAAIPETLEKKLVSQIGADNGQVLAPIKAEINLTKAVLTTQVDAVRTLLAQDIDPSKNSSVLGAALNKIQNLLNPNLSNSVPGIFTNALKNVTAENGTLAKTVKTVVLEAIKPLADEVDKLGQEIREKEVAQSILQQTVAKGTSYEETVLVEAQAWSKFSGAEVHYVAKQNQPGDILIKLAPTSVAATKLSIIIEARNRESKPWGRKQIADQLNKAMARHKANAAIFLSCSLNGLAQEIGNWAIGECEYGLWVATTHDLLTIGIQFLIVRQQLAAQQSNLSKLDCRAIEAQLMRIQTAMDSITNINTHLTHLRTHADGIKTEALTLKDEIRNALTSIEDSIHIVKRET